MIDFDTIFENNLNELKNICRYWAYKYYRPFEDVFSEVVEKILLNKESFKIEQDGVGYKAWVSRIANNMMIDNYRRKKNILVDVEQAHNIPAPKEFDDKEIIERALEIIGNRWPHYRTVFEKISEGYTYDEIADEFGWNRNTIRGMIMRIRTEMKDQRDRAFLKTDLNQ